MKLRPVVKGLVTLMPGLRRALPHSTAGHNNSAIHSYERWMKHLSLLAANGLTEVPKCVVELGPGGTLGLGLSALLSGVDIYYGCDAVCYAERTRDLQLFEELLRLFRVRAGRPSKGWPDYDHLLDENLFPSKILTENVLERALNNDRLLQIRRAIQTRATSKADITFEYLTPYDDRQEALRIRVDLVVSHAVMQHVMDIEKSYQDMSDWLKPGGLMSHQIDFRSMGMAHKWNGHWACGDWQWKIIVGNRPYLINRQPCSEHLKLIQASNCETTWVFKNYWMEGIQGVKLITRWCTLTDED